MNQKKEQFGGLDKRNAAGAAALALLIAGTAVSATPRSNITARSANTEKHQGADGGRARASQATVGEVDGGAEGNC